jgi:hypothetical protein
MNTRRISFLALSALPLIACTQPTSSVDEPSSTTQKLMAGDPEPVFDPDLVVAPPPDDLIVSTLEIGDGWRKIRVAGKATDSDSGAIVAVDRELVVITDKSKIDGAPVSNIVKNEYKTTDATLTSKTLSPTLIGADALPPGEEVDIIDPAVAAQMETAAASGTSGTLFFGCSSYEKTYDKSISTTKTYSYTKGTETGNFTGSMAFNATLAASGKGAVTIKVHRSIYSLCVPYKVSFVKAAFTGNANVVAKANVDAKFEKEWHYDKKVAQPSLGSLSFSIAGFPVKINFSAPIHVGVDAEAKATLKLDGSATGNATLNVTCTSGGCSGSKSATYGWTAGTTPTVAAEAKVKISPYAYAGIHANLYTDWIANAEIGVKAKAMGDLWGYAGNTCGDGDFNGSNEFVTALALDARVGVDLVAKASILGSDKGPWSWKLVDKHVAFWDLGSSGAMSPMLNAKAQPLGTTTAVANGRMRPCWPWTDKMKYRVNFNDGSTTEFYEVPSTMFAKSHNYGSFGPKVVSVTAIVDEQGRTPGKTTTDNVYLKPLIFDPDLVLTAKTLEP